MKNRRWIDILFIILVFGMHIIILNIDENFDDAHFLHRYMWLLLIIAYQLGRLVSFKRVK